MKILVCVKQVPDSAAEITVEDGRISWGGAKLVINPWDEYAVEAALKAKETQGGSVTVLGMGKEGETEALKHALAMGCNDAVLISDPELAGLDNTSAAKVIATAINHVGNVDLIVFGKQAIDSDTGLLPSQVARVLGYPVLSLISAIDEISEGSITVVRSIEEGKQTVQSGLPAVLSVSKDFGEPRYPSFMGIRKAARAAIPIIGLGELGIEAPQANVSWGNIEKPPAREITTEIIDGDTPEEIAEKLADKIMSEKVL